MVERGGSALGRGFNLDFRAYCFDLDCREIFGWSMGNRTQDASHFGRSRFSCYNIRNRKSYKKLYEEN